MIYPIKESVRAKGHTPQYQMHKYFARRPYNVFSNLIAHYTKKGDTVLDCFCGGGVTVFESLALDRKAIGVDINPLAAFITEMQVRQPDIKKLREFFDMFLAECTSEFSNCFKYDICGTEVDMEWLEWVYEVRCPHCGAAIRLTEENKVSNGKYRCSDPDCPGSSQKGVARTSCLPYRSVPLRLKYKNADGSYGVYVFKETEREDVICGAEKFVVPESAVQADCPVPQNWDRWYEDCLPQKGIQSFSDLFTKRNYYVNTMIFNKILALPDSDEKELLYFAFSSSLRYTNKMARVSDKWENGNPTCMDKHAYWLPNVYVECNVIEKLSDRMNAVIRGLEYTNTALKSKKQKAASYDELKNGGDYMVLTQSSADLPLPDESIDVVITDPPYGSNVQYSELSSFWNIWFKQYKGLDNFIYNDAEAVANRKTCFEGAKDTAFYGRMLREVYTEAARVLKPDGYLVFTFNNKNINVWVSLLKAVMDAGFYLPENGVIYQDFIEEYKNTAHLRYSGNIHGDFIYSFKKGSVAETDIPAGQLDTAVRKRVYHCLDEMYKAENAYTTTELYEKIYGSLIRLIMQFINHIKEKDLAKTNDLSKTFIDDLLGQKLEMRDGKWYLKEGTDFAD